jgi:FkbM family methyltransferase
MQRGIVARKGDSNVALTDRTYPNKLGSRHLRSSLLRILLVERRLPGRFYKLYFEILGKLGVKKVTVRDRGLRVSGYTENMWEYFVISAKGDYEIPGFQLSDRSVVIDIGANQGFYSLDAARKGAHVFSFEPSPANFSILRQNIEQNNLSDLVTCFQSAVSGGRGTATLYEGLSESGQFLSTTASIVNQERGGAAVRGVTIEMQPLDDVFEENRIEVCDLLKIDCEGSEYDILPAISAATYGRIRYIAMEYHNGRLDDLTAWLTAGGFEIISIVGDDVGILKARNKALA